MYTHHLLNTYLHQLLHKPVTTHTYTYTHTSYYIHQLLPTHTYTYLERTAGEYCVVNGVGEKNELRNFHGTDIVLLTAVLQTHQHPTKGNVEVKWPADIADHRSSIGWVKRYSGIFCTLARCRFLPQQPDDLTIIQSYVINKHNIFSLYYITKTFKMTWMFYWIYINVLKII